jgi:hypothetical protein
MRPAIRHAMSHAPILLAALLLAALPAPVPAAADPAACPLARAAFAPVDGPADLALRASGAGGGIAFELRARGTRERLRFRLGRMPDSSLPALLPAAGTADPVGRVVLLGPDLRTVEPAPGASVSFAFFEGLWGHSYALSLADGRERALPPEGLWRVAACRR